MHMLMAIEACKARKMSEKPLTFTIKEGQALTKAVRDNGVILAAGSQQRSMHFSMQLKWFKMVSLVKLNVLMLTLSATSTLRSS